MNPASAIANTRAHLLSQRNGQGHWEGELSSSALSTATAIVALALVDGREHGERIAGGARWLLAHPNADGGWGDTTASKSNLSTTLLCWSALTLIATQRAVLCPDEAANSSGPLPSFAATFARCEAWIRERVGSLEPAAICRAVIARYGKDRTFSVPILMTCAICGRLGPRDAAWRRVLALPFELAALPRAWFGVLGLPVVSYALPALIAIGHARYHHAPPAWWNPLRWVRGILWPRISPMLRALQPGTGGYLEATPLTGFVTMALASSGEKFHPTVGEAVRFLVGSRRGDGSWAIDSNLATWVTTLSVKALGAGRGDTGLPGGEREAIARWLMGQQYAGVHPFTGAAPGAWAWTNLPGGVPDADDTSAALIALALLEPEQHRVRDEAWHGIRWLCRLQNRDGGIPTFCRGWGAMPFDRSTPEITAHFLGALGSWRRHLDPCHRPVMDGARARAEVFLRTQQRGDGSWVPLWFGNEQAPGEENPVHGTAMVLQGLAHGPAGMDQPVIDRAIRFLLEARDPGGGWGGAPRIPAGIEETANAVNALASCVIGGRVSPGLLAQVRDAIAGGADWLIERTRNGTHFPAAPIGLYFAKLWYHEKLYPVIWTLGALRQAELALGDDHGTTA